MCGKAQAALPRTADPNQHTVLGRRYKKSHTCHTSAGRWSQPQEPGCEAAMQHPAAAAHSCRKGCLTTPLCLGYHITFYFKHPSRFSLRISKFLCLLHLLQHENRKCFLVLSSSEALLQSSSPQQNKRSRYQLQLKADNSLLQHGTTTTPNTAQTH